MAEIRTLKLNLLADVSKYSQALGKASGQTSRFSKGIEKTVSKASLALKGLGIAASYAAVRIAGDSVKAASDLNEEMSKANVIFGDASKEIKAFAKTADKALGLSKTQALKAAGNFAIFAKAANLSGKEVPKFSKQLVTLSSDLASFYNTSTDDAILSIGAALRGEMEPMRKYGVLLNQNSLEQAALNYETRTGTELERNAAGVLVGSGKVLATYQAILDNTTVAQGDFNRTSEGLANQQRILTAGWENLKSGIGEALLPVMLDLVNFANEKLIPTLGQVADGFSGKPRSISNKLAQVGKDLGYGPDQGAYNLGYALRDVANSLGALFTTANSPGAGQSTGALQKLADSLEKVANGIDRVNRAWDNQTFAKTRKLFQPWTWKWSGGADPYGGLGGGGRAVGGSVKAGTPYRVGEFGPETFIPSTSGRIVPKGASGGGGNTFIFNGVIDGESARRSIEKLLRESARRTGQVSFVGNHL